MDQFKISYKTKTQGKITILLVLLFLNSYIFITLSNTRTVDFYVNHYPTKAMYLNIPKK
jgi:hypothetical protein